MTDIEQSIPQEQKANRPVAQSWLDLILYLLIGFGSYILLSGLLSFLFQELSLGASFLLFLANFVCLGGTTYLLGIRRGKMSWAWLGLRPFRWRWEWLLLGTGIAILLLPIRGLIGLLVQWIVAGNMESIQARSDLIMGSGFSWSDFGLTLLGVGILVPIAEELYFRGLIHTWFWRAIPSRWLRVLASGTIFALGHADSVGVVAASFVIGIVSPIFYERTRSLAVPIIIHITTNSAATILLFMMLALSDVLPDLI